MQYRNHVNQDTQNLHEFRLKSFTLCQEEKYHYKINTWVTFGIEFWLFFTFFPYLIWLFFDVIYSYVALFISVLAVNKFIFNKNWILQFNKNSCNVEVIVSVRLVHNTFNHWKCCKFIPLENTRNFLRKHKVFWCFQKI